MRGIRGADNVPLDEIVITRRGSAGPSIQDQLTTENTERTAVFENEFTLPSEPSVVSCLHALTILSSRGRLQPDEGSAVQRLGKLSAPPNPAPE
jgi:hypothetical protein